VIEASGSAAEWRDIDSIVQLWRDPTTDRSYWERVYCNRLVRASRKAFDILQWKALTAKSEVKDGDAITLGFDGSKFHDATGIVATHLRTGFQWVCGIWERPYGAQEWQVPTADVDDTLRAIFKNYQVLRMYCDPPHWTDYVARWAGEYGDKVVFEWWTNRRRPMSHALETFDTAIKEGKISHDGNEDLARHIGNCFKRLLSDRDEQGKNLWLIEKERVDSPHKIDLAMAAVLSNEARNDAIAAGALSNDGEFKIFFVG
jgi:phage terminase large subunit-like protein